MTTLKTDWEDGEQYEAAEQNIVNTQVNTNTTAIAGKYAKPGSGIPKADLESSVRSSLDLADGAAQASGLTEFIQDAVAAFLAQGTNVTLTYNDAGNTLTVAAAGGGLDAEAVRDAIGIAMVGLGNISITVNDAADTITIQTTATANSTDAALRDRSTHTGTQSADTLTDGTTNKAFLATERTKLTGVATGATANASDSSLRDRTTHTGTQTSASISDFTEAVQDAVGALLGAGTNVVVNYDDAANTLTISAPGGGGGGLTVEDVRDAIGVAMVGVGNITVAYNDALDTITVSTSATVNSTDAALRDRSTHTGTQSADTLTDGTTNKAFLATERTKLTGVATGATANATDAALRDRSTHTGTQTSASISDFAEAAQDALAAALAGTSGVSVTYNDAGNTITVSGLGDATAAAETIRDTMGVAMVGTGVISVTVNDAADTITISSTATANSTDAALRDRSTHTGSQISTTISDFTEAVQDVVGALLADGTGIDVVYNDAGNVVTINATGGGAASGYRQFLGAVTANTQPTITHSLNTLAVRVYMKRTWLQVGALGSALPGDLVPIKANVLDENNVSLEFVDAAANNEYEVFVEPINVTTDTTAPGAPTLATTAQGLTTVDLSVTLGTDAETALAGVDWFKSAVLIGRSAGDTFQHTGLTPNTAQNGYTAKRFNLNGKRSVASNTINTSTIAPADVSPIGSTVENSVAGTSAMIRPTYVAGSLTIAVAFVHLNHSEWYASSTYNIIVNGTQSGGWTMVPEGGSKPDVGTNFSQPSGGVHMFYKLSPNLAWTADDVTVSKTAGSQNPTITRASIKIRQYQFVDQTTPFGAPLVQFGNMPVAAFGVALAAGDYSLFVVANNNTAPTSFNGYNRTPIGTYMGADNSGYSDFFMAGEVASPTATTLNHSTSSGASGVAYAAMVAALKKAA